jgi:iron complex outermembrane receptor protein
VILNNLRRVAITDFRGNFNFKEVPEGTYTITVSYVGYSDEVRTTKIIPGETNTENFELNEEAYKADEAVITATGTKISRKDVSPVISVIDRETMDENNESALLPVINEYVPGLFVTERGVTGFGVAGGAAGSISIRGVGGSPNTGVLVLIDGSPQYMGLFGHPLPDAYVTSDAERVEVIRGPASVMYGSNAMAGAINIITRKQHKDGFGGSARLSYGSYNTRKFMGNFGCKNKGFEIFGSINHDATNGHRDNSSFDITNGYLKVSKKLSGHFKATLDGNIAAYKTYDPGPATFPDSSYLYERHWVDIIRGMASFSLDNNFSRAEGSLKLFYNAGEHKIYDGFHSNDHNFGFSLYETYLPFEGNSISAGIDYNNYGGMAENTKAMMGKGITFADTSIFEFGGYVLARQQLKDHWIFTAGLRLDYQSISGNTWVPQLGVNYLINNNNIVKASVSKGYRNPTIRELFMWNLANPNLNPEQMWCYEGSFLSSFPSRKIQFEVTLYYEEGDNLIRTVGQYPDIRYENTGRFTHYGIEFEGSWDPLPYLNFKANYAWLHMDQVITAAPEHQLFTAARLYNKKFSFLLSGIYIHNLYTSITPLAKQEYYLLKSTLSYQVLKFMNLWISGDNLLDVSYEINDDYPMPGITFFIGTNFNFYKSNDKNIQ